ncbi:MAG: DUF4439 domain-containing protein [Alphaproteobacteria bacterium]|nr:DUF4439 domain-containing protein [Alphaproteobacteria bacterium]
MSQSINPSRRVLLGGAVLSATSLGLLAGAPALAVSEKKMTANVGNDVEILNIALGLEHEAIAAYQIGAESGLLAAATMAVAILFQTHHKEHRDALVATIGQLGGTPVGERSRAHYEEVLDARSIRNEADVLALAKRLELGAANAYLGVIPSFEDAELARVAARLAADETMHWTALAHATGEALPRDALTFGS